jgi:hypothetical protein
MATTFEDYPKGQVAVQGGDLQDAYDINCAFTDGETLVHTFKGKGQASGSTGGKRSCKITFKSALGKAGFERDYLGNWEKRKVIEVRLKVPGKTITCTGRLKEPNWTSNLDSFIDFSVTIEGKYSFS